MEDLFDVKPSEAKKPGYERYNSNMYIKIYAYNYCTVHLKMAKMVIFFFFFAIQNYLITRLDN